jgi:hypothetical protein
MSRAAPAPAVTVAGNVEGDIIVGNHNFKVNTNYGTIVYQQAPPQVRMRDMAPQPPRAPRGFVDRAGEIGQLGRAIAAREAATLFGPDGAGKSALLRQVAASEAARAMPHGVVLLEGVDEAGQALGPADVVQRLFDALFESRPRLKVDATTARTYLSNTQPLVILNGIRLPAGIAAALPDLFPQGALLIESSDAPVGEATQPVRLGPLPRDDAMQLLAARANLTNADRKALDALCALLADMPLAIVVAANAIRESNLPLERARQVIAAAHPFSSDSLRAGIERAYALAKSTLSPNEKQVMDLASVAPGATVDADYLRRALNNPAWFDAALNRLQALGLLPANSPRLRLLPGLRAAARAGVDEAAVRERLLAYLVAALPGQSLDWAFCADELGNILTSIEWAVAQGRWAQAIQLGRAIDAYLTLHGLWDAWRDTLNRILQAARRGGDRANEAWALHQLGTHAIGAGQTTQAIDLLRQALDLRRALRDTVGMAYTQHNLDLLVPPAPPARGEPEPRPRPRPQSPRPRGGGALRALTWLILLSVAAVVIYLLLNPPGPAAAPPAEPPRDREIYELFSVDHEFNVTGMLERTGQWSGNVTLIPSGGQAPYTYESELGGATEFGAHTYQIGATNCEPFTFRARILSSDGQERFVEETFRPPECEGREPARPVVRWFFLHLTSLPGEDPRIREALFLAVDHQRVIDSLGVEFDFQDVDGTLKRFPYEPEKSREILAAAGAPFSVRISYYYLGDPVAAEVAVKVAEYLAEMFAQVEVSPEMIGEDTPDPSAYTGDIAVVVNP